MTDPQPPESGAEPAPRRNRWPLIVGILVALGITAVVVRGCSIRPSSSRLYDDSPDKVAIDPWAEVLANLRRQNDPAGCRVALEKLNSAVGLSQKPELQPASLTPDGEAQARAMAGLIDPSIKEIRSAEYTPLDAQYLADCLFLRDAIRGLPLEGLSPVQQAERVFAWVNRLVVDRAWLNRDERGQLQMMPPMPPVVVLNRGFGSGLERAYIFLETVRQLELEGCFVGPPEAANRTWSYAREPKPGVLPTGPMWAVGVSVGPDLFLFDPWRGEPVPGPTPGTPATLAQVRANPGLLAPWRADATRPWTIPEADVTSATAFLAVPLSALAPRLARLERELKPDAPPVRLVVDLQALQTRFAAAGLSDRTAWNPPSDLFSFTRALMMALPPTSGGASPIPDLQAKLLRSQIPDTLFDPTSPVASIEPLRLAVSRAYSSTFLEPPSPREQIARGAFADVVPTLVGKLKRFQAGQDRLRTDRQTEAAVAKFREAAQQIAAQKRLARDRERSGTGPLTDEARRAEADLYRSQSPVMEVLVDQAVAEVGAAEATFLLALAMHEKAERAQARATAPEAKPAARAAATAAWAEARGWWDQYRPYAEEQNRLFPGRQAHAERLHAQARQMQAP